MSSIRSRNPRWISVGAAVCAVLTIALAAAATPAQAAHGRRTVWNQMSQSAVVPAVDGAPARQSGRRTVWNQMSQPAGAATADGTPH